MTRTHKIALALVAAAAVAVPTGQWLGAKSVVGVDVYSEPWDGVSSPTAAVTDPDVIAAVVAAVRAGHSYPAQKCCSPSGVIVMRRTSGSPDVVQFYPGHDAEWYGVHQSGRGMSRIPRAAFVDAMRRAGVAVPLACR